MVPLCDPELSVSMSTRHIFLPVCIAHCKGDQSYKEKRCRKRETSVNDTENHLSDKIPSGWDVTAFEASFERGLEVRRGREKMLADNTASQIWGPTGWHRQDSALGEME